MKKSLLLCLTLFATSSFAYVGSIPINQAKNVGTKQTEEPNLMSDMLTKVRIYNDSSLPIKTSAYYVDSNWNLAFAQHPSNNKENYQSVGSSYIDMKDHHAEVVPPHSWIDIYSKDSSKFANPDIKYNVYGGNVKSAVSFKFFNLSDYLEPGKPMYFYHGYDDNYTKRYEFATLGTGNPYHYDPSACTALVITDNSAVFAIDLDRNACDITKANSEDMFSLY